MNFCSDQLGTTITSDKPSSEGYEPVNLLKYNPKVLIQTRHGFMTESWIKPTVKLTLSFATCIDISHIVIHPRIYNHQQIASAFLIETRTKVWNKTPRTAVIKGEDKNETDTAAEEPCQVNFVAKEFINSVPVPDVIVFRNGRFNLKRLSSNLPGQFHKYFQYTPSFNLKHPTKNACERVLGLDLTILRTFGSTIPALGKIEVWAQPCQFCPKEKVDHIISNWIRLFRDEPSLKRELSPPSTSSTNTNTSHKRQRLDNRQIYKNIEIPEEFLDSLTYDIMQQPLRLPCGLAIDSSTFDKFNSEEKKWGRPPNDPFTGAYFTDMIRPVLDISLKANIDRFLTLNCQNPSISELPRILEANFRPESNRNRISSLLTRDNDDLPKQEYYKKETTQSAPVPAPAEVQSHNLQHINSKDKLSSELFKILSPNYSKQSSSSGLVLFNGQLQPNNPVGSLNVEDKCIKCHQKVISIKNLQFYKGLCSHVIICRDCLKSFDKKSDNSCEKCSQVWKTSDCIKIHL